jgi:hypothetical protein
MAWAAGAYEHYKLGRHSANPRGFKNPSPDNVASGLNNKEDTGFNVSRRGPAANVPSVQQRYQFLKSNWSVGDDVLGPANRTYIQANNLDLKRRLQSAQNTLGLTKKQITINEKTMSGKSNVVSSQFNYTTDYWQIPKTVSSLIPEFSMANIPWLVVGGLAIYMFIFK